jgi:hypothetical protein
VFVLESAKDAFDIILQVGAGTGLLYLVRWFWWRVNAWCEVVAMVSSFLVSVLWLVLRQNGAGFSTHVQLLLTVLVTTACWVATVYLGPQTDRETLRRFFAKVQPPGPGWAAIRREVKDLPRVAPENLPLALLGWSAGCAMIWSSLFAVGNFLYGRMGYAWGCAAVFVVTGSILIGVMNRLWSNSEPR